VVAEQENGKIDGIDRARRSGHIAGGRQWEGGAGEGTFNSFL